MMYGRSPDRGRTRQRCGVSRQRCGKRLVGSRLIRNDRLDPAMSLMLTPRGPEGLPTPEV